MRLSGLALAAALALAGTAAAQQAQVAPPRLPAAQPDVPAVPPTPPDPILDGYLRRWEREMQSFQTLALQLNRIEEDTVTKSVSKFNGIAYFMKVGSGTSARNLALLQTSRDGSKDVFEKFICTGTFFYIVNPERKEIQAVELRRSGPGAMPDDNFLGMFGLRVDEAKHRYNLTLAKQDDYYLYIDIKPRLRRDQEEFEWARVVLNKSNFVPRQLQYRAPNKTQVVWDFPSAQVNRKMDQSWFDKPATPTGWKFVPIRPDADAPPKVYRNSGAP
jgi:TIGR03009 family protein